MVEWPKVCQLQEIQYLRFTILYTLHKVWKVKDIYISHTQEVFGTNQPWLLK